MAAGYVPNSPLTTLYSNTTAGTPASPDAVDGAIQAIVTTVNENYEAALIINNGLSGHKNAAVLDHPDQSVTTAKIKDLAVTTTKYADVSVTTLKLALGAVTSNRIANGAVGATQIDPTLLQNFGEIAIQAEFDRRGVNVMKFGAIGDGVADDTSAIQAAIDYAQSNNLPLYLPPGTFKTTATLTITKRVTLYGSGMGSSIIKYYGAGVALKIQPPTDRTSNTFYTFSDIGVEPGIAGGGTYGIDIVLGLDAYFSNWEFSHIYVGDFGNYGIHFNNDIPNMDGFFTGTIRRCWITNGINGSQMGDSLTISENTITGRNTGILMSQRPGATQLVIRENNITTSGGAIVLVGATQPNIFNNQMEYLGDYTGVYDSFVTLLDTSFASIEGNTITPYSTVFPTSIPPSYAIKIDGISKYNVISKNLISNKADKYHTGIGTSSIEAVFNTINKNNTYGFETPDQARNFNGSVNNAGVAVSVTLLNAWVSYEALSTPKVKKLEDGTVVLMGAIKSGTASAFTLLFTLPVGFRPPYDKRFQVTNFDGAAFTSVGVVVAPTGDVVILSAVSNNLLQLDGIQFTLD